MALFDGLIIWIHLLCSSIWVGGSLFLGLVIAPLLKTIYPDLNERVGIMIRIGRRFNKIAIPAFGILIITGIYNSQIIIVNPNFLLSTNYGILLSIKIILVIITIITYVIHIRLLSSDVEKSILYEKVNKEYVESTRTKIIHLGRTTVILSIIILLLASFLDSGVRIF